jgi:hypothetical protein
MPCRAQVKAPDANVPQPMAKSRRVRGHGLGAIGCTIPLSAARSVAASIIDGRRHYVFLSTGVPPDFLYSELLGSPCPGERAAAHSVPGLIRGLGPSFGRDRSGANIPANPSVALIGPH